MARIVFSLLILIHIYLFCCETRVGALGSWVPQDVCWSTVGSECRARFIAASILEDPTHINRFCCDAIFQWMEGKRTCNDWMKHPKKPNQLVLMSTIIDYCKTPEPNNTIAETGGFWRLACIRRLSSSPLCVKKVIGVLSVNGGRDVLDLECCPEMDNHSVTGGDDCLGLLSKFEKGRSVVSACNRKAVVSHGKPVLP